MPENKIKHKELWQRMGNIKQRDWIKAGGRLGLHVSIKGGRGSHIVIKDPKCSNPVGIRGLITTVQKDLRKQHNQTIFKQFLDYGIEEDRIWRALKMLK